MLTNHYIPRPPKKTTSSQRNQPQKSTHISSVENPQPMKKKQHTNEEKEAPYQWKEASLSEPLTPAIRQAPLSEPQYEPTHTFYPSLQY